MVSEQSLHDDIELVLLDVLDNRASEADFSALVEALRGSDDLRKRACKFLCDEALLSDEVGITRRASQWAEILAANLPRPDDSVGPPAISPVSRSLPARTLRYINQHGLAIAAAAVLVIIGLLAQNMLMMAKVTRLHALVFQADGEGKVEVVVDSAPKPPSDTSGPALGEIVGRVIGLNETHWRPGTTQFTYGDSLCEGQIIHLESGGLEILLTNGAKITAAGPSEFELSSLVKMDLQNGKIVAAVPRTARGYTIMTPSSELVDIGTQFGVSVSPSGDTELHVFDGDVVARSRVKEASEELIHARENEAIRFDSNSPKLERFAAQEAGFVRRLAPEISASELPQLPRVEELCLWYAADMIRDVNVEEPVSVWRDILVGDNKFANDARQFDSRRYPTLVADALGRKSLKFDGWASALQIDPLDYSGCYTIFIACAPGPTSFANEIHGGMLFKHGEAPSLEMSILSDFTARSWVWPGRDQSNVGIVRSQPLPDSQISLIACKYDSVASSSEIWINGVSQQQSDAPVELRSCAPAFLGSHSSPVHNAYFFGNIYEVVIYDGAVDADSREEVETYLRNRYLISHP